MLMVTRKRHRTTQPAVVQNQLMAGRSDVEATRKATRFVSEVSMMAVPPCANASPSRSPPGNSGSAASNASVRTRMSSTPMPTARKTTRRDTSDRVTPQAMARAKPMPSASITRHTAPNASARRDRRQGRPPSMSAMKMRMRLIAPAMNGCAPVTFREISSSTDEPDMPTSSTSGSASRRACRSSWKAFSHASAFAWASVCSLKMPRSSLSVDVSAYHRRRALRSLPSTKDSPGAPRASSAATQASVALKPGGPPSSSRDPAASGNSASGRKSKMDAEVQFCVTGWRWHTSTKRVPSAALEYRKRPCTRHTLCRYAGRSIEPPSLARTSASLLRGAGPKSSAISSKALKLAEPRGT
mmetsp:Transcript_46519/g.148486  ORF Transcript_46519/g.148486 Transcript_46519/m.148486 type:complete len:356 (-) Transcript_46519:167-1234(-)